MTNPIIGILKTLFLFIRKRVQFDRNAVDREIEMPDGKSFRIFRRISILVPPGTPQPGAYFWVRFKPKNMGIDENIRFSRLPMMVFMGFRGFRSKYWAVDHETGVCLGLYEWQTLEDAENYSTSIAMRFMTKRSFPESIKYGIVD
ncbi:MAG: hypothetical protein E4G96_10630, partial [Chrysiogenales bacterium]